MSANELLVWMSARGQGSWQQFRSAVEELHLREAESNAAPATDEDVRDASGFPRYQELRFNLERPGHAEFFAGAAPSGWRVTPPTLATAHGRRGWCGTLIGARTPKLLERVQDATAKYSVEIKCTDNFPDQVIIHDADLDALSSFADRVGLMFQVNAPVAMLMSLPVIDDSRLRQQTDLPIGSDWSIERFSVSAARWRRSTRQDAEMTPGGLFRFSFHFRRLVLFCSKGRAFEISAQVAKYLLLFRRRRQILRFDPVNLHLSVPATYRPPLLIERALILCGNVLPTYDPQTGLLRYEDIPRAIAELVGALLRQGLK